MTSPVVNRHLLGSSGERWILGSSLAYGSADCGVHGRSHSGGDGGGEEAGTDGDGAHCVATVGNSWDIHEGAGASTGCGAGGVDAGIATGVAGPYASTGGADAGGADAGGADAGGADAGAAMGGADVGSVGAW